MYSALVRLALGRVLGGRPDLGSLDAIAAHLREKAASGEKPRLPFQNRFLTGDMKKLRKLQEKRLRVTVRYVAEYVPFYRRLFREAKIWPEDIRSPEDLRKLRPTRKDDLRQNFDSFFSRHPAARFIASASHSSGTTGKPLSIYYTHYESEYRTLLRAIGSLALGASSPRDIVQLHLGAGRGAGTQRSAEATYKKIGAIVLNDAFVGPLEQHVASIFEQRNIPGKKPRVSILLAHASYLLCLTTKGEELGYNLQESGLETIATGAQHVSDYLKSRVKQAWGQDVFEGYGLTETVPCSASDCREHGSLHFRSIFGYPEVVDPSNGEPVPAGEEGALLITTFYPARESMPFLRYWTGDKVVMDPETCSCGIPSDMILDVKGRLDNVFKIGGGFVYPEGVAQILSGHSQLGVMPRFNLEIVEVKDGEELRVQVESPKRLSKAAKARMEKELAEEMKSVHQILRTQAGRCTVEVLSPGGVTNPIMYKTTG